MLSSASGSRKRVLITALHIFLDRASGSAQLAFDEAKYLAALGHEVWFAGPAVKPESPEYEFRDGLHIVRYGCPQLHALDPRKLWQHRVELRKSINRHLRGQLDVVHGHVPLQHKAALDLDLNGATTCYSIHSPLADELRFAWPNDTYGRLRRFVGLPLAARIERQCISNSARVTAFSQFTKGAIASSHGDLAARINVIPGWTDLSRFHILANRSTAKAQLGWPSDVPVFFTLRRLVPRMGLDRLIQAARTLIDRGHRFQLVIGGQGKMRTQLERLVHDLSLQREIRFLGYVSDADIPIMYGACDAFVLPTAELECFGIIAAEALASGRPVLATPVGAIPEMIAPLEPQWLANGADSESIAVLLSDFLEGKLPQHAPEELRCFVARNYDREVVLKRFCHYILDGT